MAFNLAITFWLADLAFDMSPELYGCIPLPFVTSKRVRSTCTCDTAQMSGTVALPRPHALEIVSGSGLSADQVAEAMQRHIGSQQQALATSIEPDMYAAIRKVLPGVKYHARAKMLIAKNQDSPAAKSQRLPGSVVVVSSGPADLAVADQCRIAAEHLGCYVMSKVDMTVANMRHVMQNMQGELHCKPY